MRLIRLSNFINNILSRIVHDRVEYILPKLILSVNLTLLKGEVLLKMFFLLWI